MKKIVKFSNKREVKFELELYGKAGQIVSVADGSPPSLVKAFVGGA